MKKLLFLALLLSVNGFSSAEKQLDAIGNIGSFEGMNAVQREYLSNIFNSHHTFHTNYTEDLVLPSGLVVTKELADRAFLCDTLPADQQKTCYWSQFYFYLGLMIVQCIPFAPDVSPTCAEYALFFDAAYQEFQRLNNIKPNN